MQVVDTSVIVRTITCTEPQEVHRLRDVIADCSTAVAHVLAETYATLTRLPQPYRVSPVACLRFLNSAFPRTPLTLSSEGYLRVLRFAGELGISGGAIYDLLIAQTATEHDATLLSLDARAASNYALVGANYTIV